MFSFSSQNNNVVSEIKESSVFFGDLSKSDKLDCMKQKCFMNLMLLKQNTYYSLFKLNLDAKNLLTGYGLLIILNCITLALEGV